MLRSFQMNRYIHYFVPIFEHEEAVRIMDATMLIPRMVCSYFSQIHRRVVTVEATWMNLYTAENKELSKNNEMSAECLLQKIDVVAEMDVYFRGLDQSHSERINKLNHPWQKYKKSLRDVCVEK